MPVFDTVIILDWSGGNDRGRVPKADAIWAAVAGEAPVYLRNRHLAEAWIATRIDTELIAGRRVFLGFDFAFAYPAGFALALTGNPDPLALWDWFAARVEDRPDANNRFDLAGRINARFPGIGPFWGNGLRRDIANLPRRGNDRTFRWHPPRRLTEMAAPGSFEAWQLAGAGAVGSQVIMGLPVLARLRRLFAGRVAVWPFDPPGAAVTLVEVWPSLIAKAIAASRGLAEIKDAAQVRVLAQAVAGLSPANLGTLLACPVSVEGWIFGAGHATALQQAARAAIDGAGKAV